jgi:hypothetical protein
MRLSEYVDYFRIVSSVRADWLWHEVYNDIQWYLKRNTAILLNKNGKKAMMLVRFIHSDEEAIKQDVHFPDAPIVFVDWFSSEDTELTLQAIMQSVSRWKGKQSMMFARYERDGEVILHVMTPQQVLKYYRFFMHRLERERHVNA